MSPQRPLILLVEDNEDDAALVQRAFQTAGVVNPVYTVKNGMEAIAYLGGDPPYQDRSRFPLPVLVLLDIRMPLRDGFAVLKWIRSTEGLARLRVVMLTSSDAVHDADLAYKMGANSFLIKPLDFLNAAELSRSIQIQLP